jgi:hypothetical protein
MSEVKRSITDDLSDIETKKLELPNYFDTFGEIESCACLNWRFDLHRDVESQFFDMGRGYFETALELIGKCLAENRDKKANIWIFPIMFHVVHGIEIYLKGLNSLYKIHTILNGTGDIQKSKIEGKHDIRQLCQVAIKQLRHTKNHELIDEMLFVQKFIDILYANTDDMTFARYPINSKKDAHFYVKSSENVAINLNVLRQWVKRLFSILDNITSYIDWQIETLKDMSSEMLSNMDYY